MRWILITFSWVCVFSLVLARDQLTLKHWTKKKDEELLDEEMDSTRDEDNASAQFDKGYIMLHGEPKEQNHSSWNSLADSCSKEWSFACPIFSWWGIFKRIGSLKNESEARKWLRLSAEQDDFLAQNVLAWLLVNSKIWNLISGGCEVVPPLCEKWICWGSSKS